MRKKIILQAMVALLFNSVMGITVALVLGINPVVGAVLANLTAVALGQFAPKGALQAGVLTFINLGKKVGYEELEKVLKAMQPQAKLTAILNQGHAKSDEEVKYTKLSEVPSTEILTLREQNPKEYARLYKAEYGMELPE